MAVSAAESVRLPCGARAVGGRARSRFPCSGRAGLRGRRVPPRQPGPPARSARSGPPYRAAFVRSLVS